MGRRKATTKKLVEKKRPVLDTVFKCPFCCHDQAIQVKLDMKDKIGTLSCRRCGEEWSTHINYLTEPIDIYAEWIDACKERHEEVEEEQEAYAGTGISPLRGDDDDEDDD